MKPYTTAALASRAALTTRTALATWMLEHMTLGCHREALCGDLLEEFQGGRSEVWYWRQVLSAIAIGGWRASRPYAFPLLFSAGWSSLYPAWRFLARDRILNLVPHGWAALRWPYSSCLQIVTGVLPAVTFIWFGLLVYLIARPKSAPRLSPLRLVQSLSTSVSVLLLTTVGLLYYLSRPAPDLHSVTRDDFYSVCHLFIVSLPLAASLFAAILSASLCAKTYSADIRLHGLRASKPTR